MTGQPLTDRQLVDRIRRGDKGAGARLIQDSEKLVAKIIGTMVNVAEDRKDIAQDTYLKTFHKLDTFDFQAKLTTWIARIAYNTAVNWLRKKHLVFPGNLEDQGIVQEGQTADREILQKDLSQSLRTHIDSLPAIQQLLLSLFHQQELSYSEIIEITGLPEGTIKNYLFRARQRLRQRLLAAHPKEVL